MPLRCPSSVVPSCRTSSNYYVLYIVFNNLRYISYFKLFVYAMPQVPKQRRNIMQTFQHVFFYSFNVFYLAEIVFLSCPRCPSSVVTSCRTSCARPQVKVSCAHPSTWLTATQRDSRHQGGNLSYMIRYVRLSAVVRRVRMVRRGPAVSRTSPILIPSSYPAFICSTQPLEGLVEFLCCMDCHWSFYLYSLK